jgi:hypothetical protein
MLKVAEPAPETAGLNTTLMLQLAPTAMDVPQVLVWENGWEPEVESAIFVIGSAKLPVFVTVTDEGALCVFVIWLPNDKEFDESEKLDWRP